MLSALVDLVAMTAGVLIARYLMRLATPKQDLQAVERVVHNIRQMSRQKLPNLTALRVRLYSALGLDHLLLLRVKLAYAVGSRYVDDR